MAITGHSYRLENERWPSTAGTVSSAAEFHQTLEDAWSRAASGGHGCSLLTFRVGGGASAGRLTKDLACVAAERIWRSHEVGWLDDHHVGLLLHGASGEKASAYAEHVRSQLATSGVVPQWAVCSYPVPWRVSLSAQSASAEASPSEFSGSEIQGIRSPMPRWKRVMDVVLSSMALVALVPLMIPIAIVIKLTSKGPVVFRQSRAGLNGESFTCYKFRSMVDDAEKRKEDLMRCGDGAGATFKMLDDPRVTRFGRLLRQTSLDELPQFFNVLKGDMSLVGPRPLPLEEALKQDTWHRTRLLLKPGITCLWQVYSRHDRSLEAWSRLDIEYARRRSFWLDVKLLLLTIPAVLSGNGAC